MESSLVYWLDGDRWVPVSWDDWHRWKWEDVPLRGIPGGDHRFVCIVIGEDGEVVNIIPHRYVLADDGQRLRGDNGPLTAEDIAFERSFGRRVPTSAERQRLDEIGDRIFQWCRPSTAAARSLISILPGPLKTDPKHKYGVCLFMAACGLVAPPPDRLQ